MNSFLTFINQQVWDLDKRSTLLAVSGGVDSVVLAHLFFQAGLKAGILHCNFGLRGQESEGDERFVRELAERYGFQFFTKKFDVNTYKKQHTVSTQMAARDLRYAWFEEVRAAQGYDFVATAHHLNDSIETVFLNLVRGTGISGLKGITAQSRQVIRPLLESTREEILHYAQENSLSWREDSSNASENYNRNLVRHQIIPVAKQLNPSLEKTFLQSSGRIAAANRILADLAAKWKQNHIRREGNRIFVPIEALLHSGEPEYYVWETIQELGFNYAQCIQIARNLTGIPGKVTESETYTLLRDRVDLIMERKQPPETSETLITSLDTQISIDETFFQFSVQRGRDSNPRYSTGKHTANFDADLIRLPLKIRRWKTGDKFFPLGMKGKSKKVSDLFTDLKLNQFQKQKIWLLENANGDIIWVVGLRMDERYKVSEATERRLVVSVGDAS